MPKFLEYSEDDQQGGFEKRKKRPDYNEEGQRDPSRDKKRKKKELDLDQKRKIKRGYLED